MERLNQDAYEVGKDNLIYDHRHPIDARNVSVVVPEGKGGTLKRGQVIDFDETGGTYEPHKEGGVANCIVARDTDYAGDETEVTVNVYIGGDFRMSECLSDTELTSSDMEHLRSSGIILK